MGCSDCGNRGGCDSRKGTQRELLAATIERVYPTRTWGRPDDEARFGAGVPRREARRLGRSLAAVVQAPARFRPGEPEDLCDFVWILCVGREPPLLDVRDGLAEAAPDEVPGVVIEERYLRVAFSSVARMAAVQEVALALDGETIRETARPGVFDPILLKRMQKVVALLEASDIAHVDFGLLDVPLDGAEPGDYAERYGVAPRLVNFLFQAAPATASRITTTGAAPPAATTTAAATA